MHPIRRTPQPPPRRHLLATSTVAARTGHSDLQILELIASGQLPAKRLGAKLFVPSDALERFLKEGGPGR